jgi:hypothetical protein
VCTWHAHSGRTHGHDFGVPEESADSLLFMPLSAVKIKKMKRHSAPLSTVSQVQFSYYLDNSHYGSDGTYFPSASDLDAYVADHAEYHLERDNYHSLDGHSTTGSAGQGGHSGHQQTASPAPAASENIWKDTAHDGCVSNRDWVCDACYMFIDGATYSQTDLSHHGKNPKYKAVTPEKTPVQYCAEDWAEKDKDSIGFFFQRHPGNNHEICSRYSKKDNLMDSAGTTSAIAEALTRRNAAHSNADVFDASGKLLRAHRTHYPAGCLCFKRNAVD